MKVSTATRGKCQQRRGLSPLESSGGKASLEKRREHSKRKESAQRKGIVPVEGNCPQRREDVLSGGKVSAKDGKCPQRGKSVLSKRESFQRESVLSGENMSTEEEKYPEAVSLVERKCPEEEKYPEWRKKVSKVS